MSEKRTTITIPPELDAEMTLKVRAFVEVLLARIESFLPEESDRNESAKRISAALQRASTHQKADAET